MFSNDKNIETLSQLLVDLKDYVELRLKYGQIELVSKMTVLVSALVLGVVLFMLGVIVVLFLSYTAALALAQVVGGETKAFGIVTACYVMAAVLIYSFRQKLIIRPISRFLGELFLKSPEKGTDKKA